MSAPTAQKKVPKKRATKLKTLVALVLDETGSMHKTASDTRGAVNAYFAQLKTETPDAVVSIMEFSDNYGQEPVFRVLVNGVDVGAVPQLTEANYRPRGDTPLLDAIGKAVTETSEQKADRYLLLIMSDGIENASREWTLSAINALLERKQAENWTVVYLGANQDAWSVGGMLGVRPGNTMSYAQTPSGIPQTMRSLARASGIHGQSVAASTGTFFADAKQTADDYKEPSEPKLWK